MYTIIHHQGRCWAWNQWYPEEDSSSILFDCKSICFEDSRMLSLHHISPTSTFSSPKREGGVMSNEPQRAERRGGEEGMTNQLVGLMLEWVKKVAVVGSPMPSMWGMCLSRKWGGISLGIGCPSSINNIMESFTTSDRTSRIVAIKLLWCWLNGGRERRGGERIDTLILFHPTNMGWESKWFLSLLPIVALMHLFLWSAPPTFCTRSYQHSGIYPLLFFKSIYDS